MFKLVRIFKLHNTYYVSLSHKLAIILKFRLVAGGAIIGVPLLAVSTSHKQRHQLNARPLFSIGSPLTILAFHFSKFLIGYVLRQECYRAENSSS